MRTFTASMLAAVALVFASVAHAVPQAGDVPPPYLGKDQRGKTVDLKDLRGKVVIVTFWATWCPPCRKELPVLETIQQHAGRDRVRVIAVNIEKAMVYRPMKRRLKDYKMTLTNDHNGRIKKRYGVNGIPHMVMIKKDGTIAAVKRGYSEAMVPAVIDEVNALMRAEYAVAANSR
ncbi:MAG: TlpA family protein disulfide reductase [Gammaproteobacteria bacterium]|nr:TlpA family protein disulfide reductase [Gammaproteobacteria bacterium]MYF29747.1 TlpA family protein disulfide reductase [Gammaproteobacteria bacterium]MYK45976.1 TlpA family protein disulfide reductase [Gammaproteobacteria bacterium]